MSIRLRQLLLLELSLLCLLSGSTAKKNEEIAPIKWEEGDQGTFFKRLTGRFGETVGLHGTATEIVRAIPIPADAAAGNFSLIVSTKITGQSPNVTDGKALMHVNIQDSRNQWTWSHNSTNAVTRTLCYADPGDQNSTFVLTLNRPDFATFKVQFEVSAQ